MLYKVVHFTCLLPINYGDEELSIRYPHSHTLQVYNIIWLDSCETPQGSHALLFDPDKYPHCALKAFNDYYSFDYHAQYPYPPKHVIDNEKAEWKSENEDREPTVVEEKNHSGSMDFDRQNTQTARIFCITQIIARLEVSKGSRHRTNMGYIFDTHASLLQTYREPHHSQLRIPSTHPEKWRDISSFL